jgi:RNA polymerase sigma-70 factor (ECF subfamily)
VSDSALAPELIFSRRRSMSGGDGRSRWNHAGTTPAASLARHMLTEGDRSAAWPGLMRAAQDGDQRAYADLLHQILPVTRAMVRRRIHDGSLIDEVVQDVLLTLHRVRHTYDPDRPFMPWLAAIASARAIDQMRKRRRRAVHEVFDETAMLNHPDEMGDRNAEALDAQAEVARLLDRLPPRQREALKLVKLDELSLAEAAAMTGQSVGALKVTVHRAIRALRGWRENGR